MSKAKNVAYLGIAIALYVVIGMTMKIPLIAHIGTDLGYIVFGFCCYVFGWSAFIVGVIGCMIESLLVSGWIPVGWMLGQLSIGLICGEVYQRSTSKVVNIICTVVAAFIGIGVLKTGVECILYSIPLAVKIPKNLVATVADIIPMVIGLFIGYRYGYLVKKDLTQSR